VFASSRVHHPIIHPSTTLYRHPPITITITIPSSAAITTIIGEVIHSSVHGSLHPFVPFPKKKIFLEIDSYTIHAVGRLPGDMAERRLPEVLARHPLLVRGHVRGSTRRSCHGYPRRRFRPRVVQVILVSRSVSYDHVTHSLSLSPLHSSPFCAPRP
jgi:hypothetical protein